MAGTDWTIDGTAGNFATDEIATHSSLALTFRVTTSQLTSVVRPLKQNEGQVDVLATDSGGFVAVDRANGSNTYTLTPPTARQSLRQAGDFHVRRYEETLVSQEVDEWDVEVEFVPDANREDTPSISETPGTGEWGFTTRYGEIATDRVDAEFIGTGADGVERFEILTRLTFDESHAFEAALALTEGVRVRQIADETNVAVDDTDSDANTLTIDSPTTAVVSDGDYIVMEWQSRRLNDAFQEVEFVVASSG